MIELLNTAIIPLTEYERLRVIEKAVEEKAHVQIDTSHIFLRDGHQINTTYKIVSESKIIELLTEELKYLKEKKLKVIK